MINEQQVYLIFGSAADICILLFVYFMLKLSDKPVRPQFGERPKTGVKETLAELKKLKIIGANEEKWLREAYEKTLKDE